MTYRILLSDGTEIWLNSGTTLKFPFSFIGDTREISIAGEAYINVAKNAKKPFIVHLQSVGGTPATVRVLGTEFNETLMIAPL